MNFMLINLQKSVHGGRYSTKSVWRHVSHEGNSIKRFRPMVCPFSFISWIWFCGKRNWNGSTRSRRSSKPKWKAKPTPMAKVKPREKQLQIRCKKDGATRLGPRIATRYDDKSFNQNIRVYCSQRYTRLMFGSHIVKSITMDKITNNMCQDPFEILSRCDWRCTNAASRHCRKDWAVTVPHRKHENSFRFSNDVKTMMCCWLKNTERRCYAAFDIDWWPNRSINPKPDTSRVGIVT